MNTTCGASNTSFGLPRPAHARRRVPRGRAEPRADERDHGRALATEMRRGRARDRLPARPRRVGRRAGSRRYREKQAARRGVSAVEDSRRSRRPQDRVRLRFLQTARRITPSRRRACSPGRRSSTRRAGTASRSTRPAAATAPARSARCASSPGRQPLSSVDPRAFSVEELKAGWRLACRAPAQEDLIVEVPPLQTRPKAALVGVGRHVILRPGGAEALPRARRSRRSRTRPPISSACSRRWTTSSCACRSSVVRALGATLRDADWKVTAVVCDDLLIDVEPGDTIGRRATRSRSTSARRPSSRRCSTSRPASRARCGRC